METSRRRPRSRAPRLPALLVLVAACGEAPSVASEPADTPVQGGTVVVLLPAPLQGMSPLTVTQNRSIQVQREILHAPLVRYDRGLSPRPWLAASWDTAAVGADSLALTFRLREDARWHDGEPVTSRDVALTWRLMRDARVPYAFRGDLASWDPRLEVVDARTVRLRLLRHADFLEVWYQTPLVPAHVLEGVPPAEVADHPSWDAPVGTGPFRAASKGADGAWTFVANPDFPAELGGRPRLDTLVLAPAAPPDALSRMAGGSAHLMLDLAPGQVERVWAAPGLRVLTWPGTQWTFVAWNHRRPWLDTPEERRALDLALDRGALADSVLRGLAEPGNATVTPSHPAFSPNPAPNGDTLEARRLLAEAGWEDRDGDGVREDAAGVPLRFSLVTNADNATRVAAARMVVAQLRRVGAEVRLDTVSFGEVSRRLAGEARSGVRVRGFDAAIVGWSDPLGKNDADLLHSRAAEEPNGFVGYRSAHADSLLDRLGTAVDEAWARDAWSRYQTLVRQEAPVSVLYYPRQLAAVSARLRGVEMDARGSFPTVATWWLGPDAGPVAGSTAPR